MIETGGEQVSLPEKKVLLLKRQLYHRLSSQRPVSFDCTEKGVVTADHNGVFSPSTTDESIRLFELFDLVHDDLPHSSKQEISQDKPAANPTSMLIDPTLRMRVRITAVYDDLGNFEKYEVVGFEDKAQILDEAESGRLNISLRINPLTNLHNPIYLAEQIAAIPKEDLNRYTAAFFDMDNLGTLNKVLESEDMADQFVQAYAKVLQVVTNRVVKYKKEGAKSEQEEITLIHRSGDEFKILARNIDEERLGKIGNLMNYLLRFVSEGTSAEGIEKAEIDMASLPEEVRDNEKQTEGRISHKHLEIESLVSECRGEINALGKILQNEDLLKLIETHGLGQSFGVAHFDSDKRSDAKDGLNGTFKRAEYLMNLVKKEKHPDSPKYANLKDPEVQEKS